MTRIAGQTMRASQRVAALNEPAGMATQGANAPIASDKRFAP